MLRVFIGNQAFRRSGTSQRVVCERTGIIRTALIDPQPAKQFAIRRRRVPRGTVTV
jgi:hypothetical protein